MPMFVGKLGMLHYRIAKDKQVGTRIGRLLWWGEFNTYWSTRIGQHLL